MAAARKISEQGPESSRKTSVQDLEEVPIGKDIMVFNRNFCIWYPAKLVDKRPSGNYLVKYIDDNFIETVPADCIQLVEDKNFHYAKESTLEIKRQDFKPRDPVIEKKEKGLFSSSESIPLGVKKNIHRRQYGLCKFECCEPVEAGSKVSIYFEPDKKWYTGRVIDKKPYLGYLVRYDGDEYVELVPGSYVNKLYDEESS